LVPRFARGEWAVLGRDYGRVTSSRTLRSSPSTTSIWAVTASWGVPSGKNSVNR